MQQGRAIALLLCLAPAAAGAQDCFAEGMRLSNEGQLAQAADAFAAARANPECADEPLLSLNEALAAQQLAEQGAGATWACRAMERFEAFAAAWDDPAFKARAEAGVEAMRPKCEVTPAKPKPAQVTPTPVDEPEPEPEPVAGEALDPRPSQRGVAALTLFAGGLVAGGAGALFLYRANTHFDEASDTHQDYLAATEPARAEALWREVREVHDKGKTERAVGYGLIGLGSALGLAAIIVAVTGDDAVSVTPTVGGAAASWSVPW